jgi:4-hydroxy-tetrahydrodipicolinate synthase
MFEGTGTALITPFKADGGLDEDGIRRMVEFQEAGGVDTLVPCGTTGESATLTHGEHRRVIELTVKYRKRARVLAGTGSNNTAEAVGLTRHAKDAGADGALVITPYYNKPTMRGMLAHYEELSKLDFPMVVYNVPGRTAVNVDVQTMLKIAGLPNVVGAKEASGNVGQIMDLLAKAPKGFTVLSGDDSLTFPLMALGARGVISVASNLVPGEVTMMVNAMLGGRFEAARELHFRLLPLFEQLFLETSPIPVKAAAGAMGLPAGPLRMPLTKMDGSKFEVLRATLVRLGALKG